MNKGVILCSLSLALLSAPILARADANPDFDEDAKPLLRQQPGLLNYVKAHFEVKETGKAKYPGDDDHRPAPPYIFRARARGSGGPYNISLLIQPGPPGRILCVVPPSNNPQAPAPQPQQPEPQPQPFQPQEAQTPYQSPSLSQGDVKPLPPAPAPAPQQTPAPQPAPAPPSGPTADTPSGPILPNSASTGTTNNPQQDLAPPPDPAPAN
jgi:outer membrane biosynthesis protein TonB